MEERLTFEWFCQIGCASDLLNCMAVRLTVTASDENDGQRRGRIRKLPLQINTGFPIQLDVQNQTLRFLRLGARIEFLDRRERARAIAMQAQDTLQCLPNIWIVIKNTNNFRL